MRTVRTWNKYGVKSYGVYEENSETDVELLDVFRTYPEARELAGEVHVVKGLDSIGRDFKIMQNEYIQALSNRVVEVVEKLQESDKPTDSDIVRLKVMTKIVGELSQESIIPDDQLGMAIDQLEENLECVNQLSNDTSLNEDNK